MSRYSTQNPRSATVKFDAKGTSKSIPCLFEEIQGKRLILEVSEPLPAYTAVTVEYNDALFLGEVITYAKINGLCKIEVKVEQILTGLQSLITLRNRLLGENTVQRPRTASVEVFEVV